MCIKDHTDYLTSKLSQNHLGSLESGLSVLLVPGVAVVLHGELLVVMLQRREVLPGLGELPLLHALPLVLLLKRSS